MPKTATPPPQADDATHPLLAEFRGRFGGLIERARKAGIETATESWRGEYRRILTSDRANRQAAADCLREAAKSLVVHEDAGEEALKVARDGTKQTDAVVRRWSVILADLIAPRRSLAEEADRLVNQLLRDAAKQEEDSPLASHGFVRDAREVVASLPVVTWDAENGTLSVEAR